MKGKDYHMWFYKKFDGIGIMLIMNRASWAIEVRLGWFKFLYIKEKAKCA